MLQQDYHYNAKIINVVDGDTLDLDIDLGFYIHSFQRIRLAGIDAPELNSTNAETRQKALEAKKFVEKYLDMQVKIKSYKQDKYGRFLADIYSYDGTGPTINELLVSNGLATLYNGGKRTA